MITREKTDELLPSRPNQIPQALGFPVSGILQPNPLTYDELNFKHPMAKVGRTTGFTCGSVSGFGIDEVTIHVHGVGNVRFDNLLEIEWDTDDKPFAKDGDFLELRCSTPYHFGPLAYISPAASCGGRGGELA